MGMNRFKETMKLEDPASIIGPALIGPVSLKLATTPQSVVSNTVGVSGLLFLGALYSTGMLGAMSGLTTPLDQQAQAYFEEMAGIQCPDTHELRWSLTKGWYCIPKQTGP